MSEPENVVEISDQGQRGPTAGARPRAVGPPLPVGSGREPLASQAGEGEQFSPPPPGRALPNPALAPAAADAAFSLQRAFNALRTAAPFIQRILPLLDGNIATAIANIFAPHPAKPAPPVDLAPVEKGLTEVQTQQHELRDQAMEQSASLKRVEEQIEVVREASDRNALEQQELAEDMRRLGHKVNVVSLIALGLLAISVLLNLFLVLHMRGVLP